MALLGIGKLSRDEFIYCLFFLEMPTDFSNLLLATHDSYLFQHCIADELWAEFVKRKVAHINKTINYRVFQVPNRKYRNELIRILMEFRLVSKRNHLLRHDKILSSIKQKDMPRPVCRLSNRRMSHLHFLQQHAQEIIHCNGSTDLYKMDLQGRFGKVENISPRVVFLGSSTSGHMDLVSHMCNRLHFTPMCAPFFGKIRHRGKMMELVAPAKTQASFHMEWIAKETTVDPYFIDSKLIVVCFSISCVTSFWEVVDKCIPEMEKNVRDRVPFIIVGLNPNHRQSKNEVQLMMGEQQVCISKEEGLDLARRVGALCYLEADVNGEDGVLPLMDTMSTLIDWIHCK